MLDRLFKEFIAGLFIFMCLYYAVKYVFSKDDTFPRVILFIVFLSSLITFFMYGVDKLKAALGKWRIEERTLLIWGICGGA